jgi:cytochrome c oxidase subunit 2
MRKGLIIQVLGLAVVVGAISFVLAFWIDWLPPAAAKQADRIHDNYLLASIICLVIFALVAGVSIYAFVKFRVPDDDEEDGKPIHGHTVLEIVWTAIPTALVTAIAVFAGVSLVKNEDKPADAMTINVKGWQFAWEFSYPQLDDAVVPGPLHVPVGRTIDFRLESPDVIHSFWVPEWSVKQDLVPGTVQHIVITPTKTGTFPIICTELCGLGHSTMRSFVVVQTQAEFDAWLAEQKQQGGSETAPATTGGETAPAETGATTGAEVDLAAGRQIFAQAGCGACHTLADAGAKGTVGPDLDKVLQGKDEAFVQQSIVDPNAEIAAGYAPNIMPQDFGKTLSREQLDTLVKYLVTVTNG